MRRTALVSNLKLVAMFQIALISRHIMDGFGTLAEIYEMEIYEINLRVGIGVPVPCTTVEVKMTQTHTFI